MITLCYYCLPNEIKQDLVSVSTYTAQLPPPFVLYMQYMSWVIIVKVNSPRTDSMVIKGSYLQPMRPPLWNERWRRAEEKQVRDGERGSATEEIKGESRSQKTAGRQKTAFSALVYFSHSHYREIQSSLTQLCELHRDRWHRSMIMICLWAVIAVHKCPNCRLFGWDHVWHLPLLYLCWFSHWDSRSSKGTRLPCSYSSTERLTWNNKVDDIVGC